jgi:hypothetical protein
MPKLSPIQLANFQSISTESFPTVIEIWKLVQSRNSRGGILESYQALLDEFGNPKKFPARANISTRVPSQRVYGEQETVVKIWDVFVAQGTDLEEGDKVILTDGTELKIMGTEVTVNETVARRCYALRIV